MGKKVASASKKTTRKRARPPMDQTRVDDYVIRLEANLGDDDAFMTTYERLQTDPELSVAAAVRIASKFVAPMAASTSKQKALERILKRHQNLMSFKRKQKAVGGRSAA